MKKYKGIIFLVVLLIALVGAVVYLTNASKVTENTEVVRVGNVRYTMGDLEETEQYLRDYYDYMGQMYTMYYGFNPMSYTDEDIRNEAVNTLAYQAVVLDKAAQLGLDKLTEEETAELEEAIAATWQSYRDNAALELGLSADAAEAEREAAIDAFLTEQGVSMEKIRKSEMDNLLMKKAEEYATKDVAVTEDEFTAAFDAKVAEQQAEYDETPTAYGETALNGGTMVYAPAGYRYAKQILVKYTDEDSEKLNNIGYARYDAEAAVTNAEAALSGLLEEGADMDALVAEVTVTLEEVTDPAAITVKETTTAFTTELSEEIQTAVKTLAEARALVAAYEAQEDLAIEAALANIAPEADEVLSRLEAGEDWDALVAEYNDDPGMAEGATHAATGYPVCAGFTYFDQAFVDAAMGIAEVGQWSDKVVGETYGYYIVKYEADVPAGAVDKETVRETITAELLTTKQEEAFSAAVDQWASEAKMVINYEALGMQ